jgi:benzoyl-CoA reductase subunit B
MHELYKTEPIGLWRKAKELRLAAYKNYAMAHEKKGLRWAGGSWALDAIPMGLGDDVWGLASEPYGASIAAHEAFSLRCLEATEKAGFSRNICSYIRNYCGSVILNEYAFPEFSKPWPKPDFIFQDHICCSHAKWYQVVSDLEGGIPMFCVDVATGQAIEANADAIRPLPPEKHAVEYIVNQCLDAIDRLEKITGRSYDNGLLRKAVFNHMRSTSTWAKICELQKTVPAPLDEKSMYSLYVLGTIGKASRWCADFYDELYDCVKDRVGRGIAAIADERMRIMSDTQPPWAFLDLFRYLEEFGCVSVGSLYTFGLIGQWEIKPDGTWSARQCPASIGALAKDRRELLAEYVTYELNRPLWQHFYHPQLKSALMINMARDWKADGAMLHFNRGCEGLSLGIAENRLALHKAGFPVLTFEGNMGDARENDKAAIKSRVDMFMETQGLKRDFIKNRHARGAQETLGKQYGTSIP